MANQDKNTSRERVIDENLRRVYEEAMDEGVPDRFKNLLEQLKHQDTEQGAEQ
ncbi:NepR family anti-sigma factor [uncultured Sulfitobacter sp.]|uniref:NepR family anti-sigma factor n=1 Tax=uncultured Sulfitobacter sp. TaxID=191468 RepID=UPI002604BEC3|nr:NepR family anti-sigma factor [uncultured Sulfitobacter sp.]